MLFLCVFFSQQTLFQLDHDLMSLYIEEGQLVLHFVNSSDDIIKKISNIATGDWFTLTAALSASRYVINSKCALKNGKFISSDLLFWLL